MKILHVSPSYYPAFKFGGPIQSVHLLNKALKKAGLEVDVFTTNAGLKENKDIPVKKWVEQDGLQVKYFPFIGYEHYNLSFSLFFALLKAVKNYDVVHITAVWNFPVWAASFACWLHKKPYIISPRGTIYPETIAIKSAGAKKMYYKLLAEKCLQKAAVLHFTSDDEAKKVTEYLGLKAPAAVVPNGVDLSKYANSSESKPLANLFPALEGKKYILFLGRINYKKGLDLLLEAYSHFLKKHPGYLLVIAGPDNDGYKNELENQAKALQIENDVFYTGPLEGSAIVSAYAHATLFVLSSYSENFGMSVVEAMACACPVLISDKVGIYKEIEANDAGFICTTTAKSVAEVLSGAIENEEKRSTIAANGLRMARNYYDIGEVANRFKALYISLLK